MEPYEEYEKIRYPLKFDELYEKLKGMKEIKRRYSSPKPAINIQGVWPMIEPDIEKYIDLMTPVSDYINYNTYIDVDKLHSGCLLEAEPEFTCSEPYQRLLILINGDVRPCCGYAEKSEWGVVGNAWNDSINEIWHGERLERFRELCSTPGGYKELEMCKSCVVAHKIKEKAVKIHGETRVIKTEYV